MIVDEAQNLTPHEVKTIITRVGEATKVILTGDPYQIDNPYVDSSSNGFNYIVSKFRGQAIAAHIAASGWEVLDIGPTTPEATDYPKHGEEKPVTRPMSCDIHHSGDEFPDVALLRES